MNELDSSSKPKLTVYGVCHDALGIDAFQAAVDDGKAGTVFREHVYRDPHTVVYADQVDEDTFDSAVYGAMGAETAISIDGTYEMFPELEEVRDRARYFCEDAKNRLFFGGSMTAMTGRAKAYEEYMESHLGRDAIMAGQIAWHEFDRASAVVGALHQPVGPLVQSVRPDIHVEVRVAVPRALQSVTDYKMDLLDSFAKGHPVDPMNLATFVAMANSIILITDDERKRSGDMENPDLLSCIPDTITDDLLEQLRSVASSERSREGIPSSEYGGLQHIRQTLELLAEAKS